MEHSIESTLIYGTLELYFQYKAEQLEHVPNGTTRTGTAQNSWNSRKTRKNTKQKNWNKYGAEQLEQAPSRRAGTSTEQKSEQEV